MITPMSYAKALQIVAKGPKTTAQRHQAVKTLRRMARAASDQGDDATAKHIRKQARKLLTQP